jgi:hypothetical protein
MQFVRRRPAWDAPHGLVAQLPCLGDLAVLSNGLPSDGGFFVERIPVRAKNFLERLLRSNLESVSTAATMSSRLEAAGISNISAATLINPAEVSTVEAG